MQHSNNLHRSAFALFWLWKGHGFSRAMFNRKKVASAAEEFFLPATDLHLPEA
jgi:hypothetical protein